jgi:hypothetical protein
MERVGEGQNKMVRYCSTGQSPQRAVEPAEEVLGIQFKKMALAIMSTSVKLC